MTESEKFHDLLIEQLDTILDQERQALLDGALDEVGTLVEQKAELIAGLQDATATDAAAMRPLQLKLRRNQELFDQALAGIRNVASRITDMRQVRRSMEIYDAHGQRSAIGNDSGATVEKRA